MANFNKVMLMGNLTRDVELRQAGAGGNVAKIGLAVNRRWKTPTGEDREETTFVDCEAWGKTAEIMAKYLSKGKPVFVEGRLKLDQWEKDGQKFSKLKVVVETFQFIDSKGGGGGGGGSTGGGSYSSSSSSGGGGGGRSSQSAPPDEGGDDIVVPF